MPCEAAGGHGARSLGSSHGLLLDRQLRLVHLQPLPVPRASWGPTCRSCATTPSPSTRPWPLRPERIVISPGPGTPDEAGISLELIRQRRGPRAAPGRVPRPPGHRPGLRRPRGARAEAHARQDVRDPPRRPDALRGPAQPLHGHALPLAGGGARVAARVPRGHGLDRRRRDHGPPPPRACPWRACSSIPRASSPRRARTCSGTSWTGRREGSCLAQGSLRGERLGGAGGRGRAMDAIMDGEATPAQIGALLAALAVRGETEDEMAGFARAMRGAGRAAAVRRAPSTPAAPAATARAPSTSPPLASFVVAGLRRRRGQARQPLGRAARCGSADVLEALGVRLDAPPETVQRCLDEVGFGFLFAPGFHAVHAPRGRPPARSSACAPSSTCSAPSPTPRGPRRQVVGVPRPRADRSSSRACLQRLGVAPRLGGPRRRGSTSCRSRAPPRWPRRGRRACARFDGDARGRRPAPLPARGRCAGGDAAENARDRPRASWRAHGARGATSCSSTPRAALVVAGRARDLRGGRAQRAGRPSTTGGPRGLLAQASTEIAGMSATSILGEIVARTRERGGRARDASCPSSASWREAPPRPARAAASPRRSRGPDRGQRHRRVQAALALAGRHPRGPAPGRASPRPTRWRGAAALSVLTEEQYFGGTPGRPAARPARPRCCRRLRKDFIVDPYQVWEAWVAGADAVLLIVAVLSSGELRDAARPTAAELGLDGPGRGPRPRRAGARPGGRAPASWA